MTAVRPAGTVKAAGGPFGDNTPVTSGRRQRPPLRYLVVAAAAVLAVLLALLAPALHTALTDTTAKDRIAADPPPELFPAAVAAARIDTLTDPQRARGHELMAPWWRAHDTGTNDAAFTTWLEKHFPGPPSRRLRALEMGEVERLDARRTDAGVTAATWLEEYGKKDVWKLEAHDQAEYLDTTTGDQRKSSVDDLLAMTKDVADNLGARFQQSAPYVLEPSLRTDHAVAPGGTCPCSYPSRHAGAAAAARTLLGYFTPQRDSDYRYLQDQIDYSRLYMAGHVSSDLTGGTLLGDMIGEYFLVTRAGADPAALIT